MKQAYEFEAEVELYPVDKGWHLVRVPGEVSKPLEVLADRGLIAVDVTVGGSTWKTSLLPYGDGSHFIPLPAKIRQKEGIALGDIIKAGFDPRKR